MIVTIILCLIITIAIAIAGIKIIFLKDKSKLNKKFIQIFMFIYFILAIMMIVSTIDNSNIDNSIIDTLFYIVTIITYIVGLLAVEHSLDNKLIKEKNNLIEIKQEYINDIKPIILLFDKYQAKHISEENFIKYYKEISKSKFFSLPMVNYENVIVDIEDNIELFKNKHSYYLASKENEYKNDKDIKTINDEIEALTRNLKNKI